MKKNKTKEMHAPKSIEKSPWFLWPNSISERWTSPGTITATSIALCGCVSLCLSVCQCVSVSLWSSQQWGSGLTLFWIWQAVEHPRPLQQRPRHHHNRRRLVQILQHSVPAPRSGSLLPLLLHTTHLLQRNNNKRASSYHLPVSVQQPHHLLLLHFYCWPYNFCCCYYVHLQDFRFFSSARQQIAAALQQQMPIKIVPKLMMMMELLWLFLHNKSCSDMRFTCLVAATWGKKCSDTGYEAAASSSVTSETLVFFFVFETGCFLCSNGWLFFCSSAMHFCWVFSVLLRVVIPKPLTPFLFSSFYVQEMETLVMAELLPLHLHYQ